MESKAVQTRQYTLVTVNTAPERARRLIGRMTDALRESYDIKHVANCESIDEVQETVERLQPDMLFCASMWTAAESERIQAMARSVCPSIVTYALPMGLQVSEGPDAVVRHLVENVPKLLESIA